MSGRLIWSSSAGGGAKGWESYWLAIWGILIYDINCILVSVKILNGYRDSEAELMGHVLNLPTPAKIFIMLSSILFLDTDQLEAPTRFRASGLSRQEICSTT